MYVYIYIHLVSLLTFNNIFDHSRNEYGLSDDLFQSTQDIKANQRETEPMEGAGDDSRVVEECISRDEDTHSHKGLPKHKGLNKY